MSCNRTPDTRSTESPEARIRSATELCECRSVKMWTSKCAHRHQTAAVILWSDGRKDLRIALAVIPVCECPILP